MDPRGAILSDKFRAGHAVRRWAWFEEVLTGGMVQPGGLPPQLLPLLSAP